MNRKKTIMATIFLFVSMVACIVLSIYIMSPRDTETITSSTPVPIERNVEEEELNITSIDGATTVEESQKEMEGYIYRVYVSNPEALYKSSLPSHGYGTFEGYLSRYIDYYVPGDELYEVQFMEGSDEAFSACTDFLVKIPDLDITVRCIYVNSLQRYDFRSPLNGYE